MPADLAIAETEDQVAGIVAQNVTGAFDVECDTVRVGFGLNDEVVFKLPLIAVIDEIDAGIDTVVPDLGVSRDVGMPFRRVISEKVVHLAGELVDPRDASRGVGAGKLHAQNAV